MSVAVKYTDAELIAAIKDERQLNSAILFIYKKYAESTSAFIMSYGGSRQDAEDVFQDTVVAFINIVTKGSYRMEASIKTFLVSVAKNIWFNEVKRRERADFREKAYEAGREVKEQDISQVISEMEQKRALRDLIHTLGESCRKILLLFYYENLSMKEILGHLPYENEQVVRNKKYKCLQQLTGIIKSSPSIVTQMKEIAK